MNGFVNFVATVYNGSDSSMLLYDTRYVNDAIVAASTTVTVLAVLCVDDDRVLQACGWTSESVASSFVDDKED